jgi:hypothetical protein
MTAIGETICPMIIGCLRRFAWVLLLAASCLGQGRIYWERKDGPLYTRYEIWRVADLTPGNIRSFYRRLAPEMNGYRAWVVKMFVDEAEATRDLYGKLATGVDYERWSQLYEQFGRKLGPVAMIMSQGRDAVARLRDKGGNCTETVLAGSNWLRSRVSRVEFEILEAYYHPLPPIADEPSPGDEAMVDINVRASPFPTMVQAQDFSSIMRSRFQERRVTIIIRQDAYFLTDEAFPIVYQFDETPSPPTKDEYLRSKTMYCFCDQPTIQCR